MFFLSCHLASGELNYLHMQQAGASLLAITPGPIFEQFSLLLYSWQSIACKLRYHSHSRGVRGYADQ